MNKKSLSTAITLTAAFLAVALAAWGGFVFCTQMQFGEVRELYALIPIYIISVFFGAFIDELVHEGAHFLVGAMCSMGVKPPKIRIFKSSSIEMYPKGVKAMRLRFILTAAAGLFFDFLLIALGVIAFAVPSVPAVLGMGLPYAFYSFVINVAPLEYASGKTDGLFVCEAIKNGPSAQVMFAVLKVQGKINAGTFLKEIDESMLLDVPQIQEDDINFIMLTQLRFEYYEAKGNDTEAYKYFMRYKQLIRYLPDRHTKGKHNKREDYDEEEVAEAEVKPGQIAKKPQEGGATAAETVDVTEQPTQDAAEEQPAEEQPAEPEPEAAEPEPEQNDEEQ